MERNFTNENFEGFLRQNAEGLRMRPSDTVWKGISKYLNRRRRRIGFILSVSLLTVSAVGYYVTDHTARQSASKSALPAVEHQTITARNSVTAVVRDIKTGLIVAEKTRKNFDNTGIRNTASSPVSALVNAIDQEYGTLITENEFTPTIVDSYDNPYAEPSALPTRENLTGVDPLTIESVINSYNSKVKKKKLTWQVFFTPTVSYRKLSENKTYQQAVPPQPNAPLAYLYDINNVVTHKPAFGFEIGFTSKYQVAANSKLRAGLQFNVNRYDIKAFSSPTQLATIRLNDRNGVDQVNTVTNYNNFGGYRTNWLENFYFQVSAPVGIELKLRGDDKMQLGIASTIQPTYVLGDRAYLISTDYKNYAEVPWLIRRWNVNTSFETFVGYSTGHLKWQVGPQVRYQLLSSFVKKYPVKENLFDFGLKVGISLNNK